jgi:hypothetical protein
VVLITTRRPWLGLLPDVDGRNGWERQRDWRARPGGQGGGNRLDRRQPVHNSRSRMLQGPIRDAHNGLACRVDLLAEAIHLIGIQSRIHHRGHSKNGPSNDGRAAKRVRQTGNCQHPDNRNSMSVRVHQCGRIGIGIQIPVEGDGVLGTPRHRVEAGEGTQARVIRPGLEVIQIGRALRGLEDPALEAPAVSASACRRIAGLRFAEAGVGCYTRAERTPLGVSKRKPA